jgi:hypothetical protein
MNGGRYFAFRALDRGRRMRLWIDGQCLQTPSRLRGIGRYVTELVRAIAENHPDTMSTVLRPMSHCQQAHLKAWET